MERRFLQLREALQAVGLYFYSYTPVAVDARKRGMEIKAWLGVHPEVKKFVILDDELFDYKGRGLLDRLVKTSFEHNGLTPKHAEVAIEMLNERRGC